MLQNMSQLLKCLRQLNRTFFSTFCCFSLVIRYYRRQAWISVDKKNNQQLSCNFCEPFITHHKNKSANQITRLIHDYKYHTFTRKRCFRHLIQRPPGGNDTTVKPVFEAIEKKTLLNDSWPYKSYEKLLPDKLFKKMAAVESGLTIGCTCFWLWRGEFWTSGHFTNKHTRGDKGILVKVDLVENEHWLQSHLANWKFHFPG